MNFKPAHLRLMAIVSSIVASSGIALAADAPVNAVPPAESRVVATKSAAPRLVLPTTAPALSIALPAPSTAERGRVKAQNLRMPANAREAVAGSKGRPLAIGFGRSIASASGTVALARLPWQTLPDGSRAARIQIVSPDAAGLRVALQMPASDPDLSVRFAGAGDGAVFGPVPANAIADDTAQFGSYWSPTIEGNTATIEFVAPAGVDLDGVTLTIPRLSHHLVSGLGLKNLSAKTLEDIGTSGPCNIDVKCVTPQSTAFVNSTKAVAQILFTQENGLTYVCTGTLMNDLATSGTPYFFTANHCINSATAARTMNTFWFFDANNCGDPTVPPYVQQATGATLLARSEDWDWALVRLVAPPPAGAYFSAWRADPVPAGSTVSVVHHPYGDLKKWSQGTSTGYRTFEDGFSFIQAVYSQGTTEEGSSGAALVTFNSSGGYYEVRGGLYGGEASCANPTGADIYSRLDKMLPLTRQYLTPGNNPSGTVVAVEFYNRTLQHYFISASAGEINDLDTGVHAGWERTGFRFLAYATQVVGTSPVCRFYREPAYGDSHFYSASPEECASTAAAHPVDWTYESPNVFYIPLPDLNTGACPANTLPIWRFFNQITTNHRYIADVATRDALRSDPFTWIPEGYGADARIMCTPAGS
jgi:lysyl endopeptidase